MASEEEEEGQDQPEGQFNDHPDDHTEDQSQRGLEASGGHLMSHVTKSEDNILDDTAGGATPGLSTEMSNLDVEKAGDGPEEQDESL